MDQATITVRFKKDGGTSTSNTFNGLNATVIAGKAEAKAFAEKLLTIKDAASISTYSRFVGQTWDYEA